MALSPATGRVLWDRPATLCQVRDVFVMIWNTHIRPGVEAIIGGFRWIWDAAVEWAQKAVTWAQNAYNAITKAWESITESISGAFETLVKAVAGLPQVIAGAFQNAISFLGDVLKHVWQDIFVPIGQKIMEGMQWIANKLGELFNTAWNAIKSMLTALAPVTPDKAENAGLTALKIAGLAAGGLLAMTAVWDLIHPVKDIIPGELVPGVDQALATPLSVPPLPDSLTLFLNGIEQVEGDDYTLAGVTITWLAGTGTAVPLDTSDELTAYYQG